MASLKDIVSLHLQNEKVEPKPVGLVDKVARVLKGAKTITEEYFEPVPGGKIRFRDVLTRVYKPKIQNAKLALKAGEFAIDAAHSVTRSAAVPVLGAVNKVRELDGKAPITSLKPDDQTSIFKRDLQKIFTGEDAIESYSERIRSQVSDEDSASSYVGRSAERVLGLDAGKTTRFIAAPMVLGSLALDLSDLIPGFGATKKTAVKAATEVGQFLSKTDNIDEILGMLKRVNVPDEIATKYADQFAKTTDPNAITKSLTQMEKEVALSKSVFPPNLNFSRLTRESEDAILKGLSDYSETGFKGSGPGSIDKLDRTTINLDSFEAVERLKGIMDKRALSGDELREAADLLVRGGRELPILEARKATRLISEETYQAASKRFNDNMKRLNSGVPLDQIPDFAVIAAYHIENGVRTLAEFTEKMVKAGYELPSETMQKLYDDAIATTSKIDNVADDIVDEIPNSIPQDGTKDLSFIQTAKNSPTTDPNVAYQIGGKYNPIKNTETLEKAQKLADDDYQTAYSIATDKTTHLTADSTAVSLEVVRRAQNEGNYELAVEVIENVASKAKNQGQAIQALSMWGRLTPEGILRSAQRTIKKFNDANPGKPPLTIDPDTAKRLSDGAKEINGMEDGYEKAKKTARILQDINELTPPSFWKKLSTYQTMAQLLNFKTVARNVIGNVGFAVLENLKDVPAAAFDSALSFVTGKKTKSMPDIMAQFKGGKEGFLKGIDEALSGVDTTNFNTQFDLPNTKTFRSGIGSKLETMMNVSLKAPDRALYQAAYDGSLSSQMRTAGITEPTDEMLNVAHHDALYRTFQDDNAITKLFVGLKKLLNFGKEFGIGDIVLKYPKTPANILSRGLAYSPAGFVKAIFESSRDLMRGEAFDQRKFVESFARATTGTAGIIGTGALMNRLGLITGKRPKDADIAAIQQETGLGQYRLNASGMKRFVLSGFDPEEAKLKPGDTLVSYDWFQPAAIGIAMGANIDEASQLREVTGKDYKGLVETLLDGVANGVNTIAEQPLLQGLTKTLKYGDPSDAMEGLAKQIPSSFVPTLLNQASQFVDNTSRSLYDPSWVQEGLNAAKRRIPGYTQTLTPNAGVFGEQKETYQDGSNNLFNVFFNPAFKSKYTPTPESELVLSLYEETGETKQAPRVVGKSIQVGGKTVELGPKRRYEMQRFVGTASKMIFNQLAQNKAFSEMPEDEQIKYMSNVLSDIGSAAKIAVLKLKPSKKPSQRTMQLLMWYYADDHLKENISPNNVESPLSGFNQILESNFNIQPQTTQQVE